MKLNTIVALSVALSSPLLANAVIEPSYCPTNIICVGIGKSMSCSVNDTNMGTADKISGIKGWGTYKFIRAVITPNDAKCTYLSNIQNILTLTYAGKYSTQDNNWALNDNSYYCNQKHSNKFCLMNKSI